MIKKYTKSKTVRSKEEFAALKQSLEAVRLAESQTSRKKYASRAERRADYREASLPADRICPVCEMGPKTKSRQWVVLEDRVLCKSCFMKGK